MAKGCALSTGYLPRGGLSRNRVNRITDRPDMTTAVDRGRKASTLTNKNLSNKMSVLIARFDGIHAMIKHYDNTSIFYGCKNDNFQMKNCHIFLIFA